MPLLPRRLTRAAALRMLHVLLGLIWLAAAAPRAQQPVAPSGLLDGEPIGAVKVEGLKSWDESQVLARLKTKPGQLFSPTDARDDLAELGKIMRTAAIDTGSTTDGQLLVRFNVTEFPRLRDVQILGNEKMKKARVETLAGLKKGDVLDERTQRGISRALRNEYKATGMPQAKVTLNVIPVDGSDSEADLQIMLDEGRQVLCGDVTLQGNQDFTTVRLKMLLETKGSWTFLKNYYDEQTFDEDLGRLRDFYAGHGYFDAKIDRGTFEERVIGGKPVISPVIKIAEGTRYTFGGAEVRGVRLFSQSEAQAPFEALKGKPFDGQKFARALGELQQLYANHGLLTTDIEPRYDYDTEAKRLDMTVQVTEKERIYVGKIKVVRPALPTDDDKTWFRGWYDRVAPPVSDETILREVLLEPSEIYNRQLEQDSLRRLSRLGVFESESLKAYNEPSGDPGVHNLVIEAAEAVTGSLSGGVGFGDASGLFVFAQASERNVGGQADVFTFGVQLGQRASGASVSFLNRHVGDTEHSLSSRLAYEQLGRPGYDATQAGLNMDLGTPLENNWTRYLGARIEGIKLEEASGIDADEDLDMTYAAVTGKMRFEQDTRWPLGGRPREGYLQSVGTEIGYANAPLIKLEGGRDQYMPLTERLTYRLAASGGLMPYDRDVVPIHERYFLGGNNDMRGFKFRGAGYFDDEDDDVPIGGAARLLAKNELLFPIYDPVSGVLFTDVGALGKSPVSWQVPRVSSGAGLRFDLKNVQVGLDLAVPIVRQSDDQTRFFHFSLQSQF